MSRIIDPRGDIVLKLTTSTGHISFMVNSHILCVASPVFRAMLGANSRFKEAADLAVAQGSGTTMELGLEDDDADALETILLAVHSRSDKVPRALTEIQLYDVAILCDKYDMKTALAVWVEYVWVPPLKTMPLASLGDRWLYMSYVFAMKDIFNALTARILSSEESYLKGTGQNESTADDSPEHDPTEHVPEKIIEALKTERFSRHCRVLDYIHQLVNDYLAVEDKPRCGNGGLADCDAVILGCLLRELKKYPFFPLADTTATPTQAGFLQFQAFMQKLCIPYFYSTLAKDPHNYYGGYNNYPTLTTHESTCSPIPLLQIKIDDSYDNAKGLDLDDFLPQEPTEL